MNWKEVFLWSFFDSIDVLRLLLILVALLFIFWMLIDCLKRQFKVNEEKWIWFGLISFLTLAGIGGGFIFSSIYYITVRLLNKKGISKK